MSIISDIPPDALAQAWEIIEKRRKQERSEKLGKEVGTWGGKRPGAFGLKREYNVTARLTRSASSAPRWSRSKYRICGH